MAYNNGRFTIGCNSAQGEAFVGYIEGVRVYSRALSAAEVAWLYAEPYAGFVSDDLDFAPDSGGGGATRLVKMAGRWGGYAGASGGFAG